MSKNRRDFILFVEDIVNAITKIEEYTKGLNFDKLKNNHMVVDAVIRNFEIIGEAVKSIPRKVKVKYPNVEWLEVAGFRDILNSRLFWNRFRSGLGYAQ